MNFKRPRFRNMFLDHLSDRDVLLLMSGELSATKRLKATQHLEACSMCRLNRARFGYAGERATEYLDRCVDVDAAQQPGGREKLAARLERLAVDVPITEQVKPSRASGRPQLHMNPILTAAMIFAIASVACVFVWLQQARPNITSNALLVRAEAWDPAMSIHMAPGVIRQTVSIQTRTRIYQHTAYRDTQGKRRLRPQKSSQGEAQLQEKLASANVPWDAPLSAASYQDWHDGQRVRQDEIRRAKGHLLVLTTTTPYGKIASQSLTVRDTDFHPIIRTVAFRNDQTVEIAELDYQVLPWNKVDENLFLPPDEPHSEGVIRPQPVLVPLPTLPPTQDQLDEAELGVRFVLNQLHADTGEQIRIERGPFAIEVKGLVETNQRKRELSEQLRMIPRAKASILSMEELQQSGGGDQSVESGEKTLVAAFPSPLEALFVKQGRDAASLRTASQALISSAFVVSQESKAITDLLERFTVEDKLTPLAKGTLTALVFSHRQKLFSAIEQERMVLDSVAPGLEGASPVVPAQQGHDLNLVDAANRNFALCEELGMGGSSHQRSAEPIFFDLEATLARLRTSAHQSQLRPGIAEKAIAPNN